MERNRHDPIGTIAKLGELAEQFCGGGTGVASLRGVELDQHLFFGPRRRALVPCAGRGKRGDSQQSR